MQFYESEDMRPERSIGYLAKRLMQLSHSALEPRFAGERVTFVQWTVLVSIALGQGGTAAALARHLCHDAGATTRMLDVLEKKGFVVRVRDRADRRVVNLELTPEGEQVAIRGRDMVTDYWNKILVDWDRDDVEKMLGYLSRLRNEMEQDA